MSFEAMRWAIEQHAPNSSSKFVLVALANAAHPEDWLAWPSVAYISGCTQQDRKTVLANLARLEQSGLIERAGKAGRTGQVIRWRLSVDGLGSSTKNGTSTKSGTVPFFPPSSTAFPAKRSQYRDTEPVKNQIGNKSAPQKRAAGFDASRIDLPEWLPREPWTAWVADRKERRKPISRRAADAQIKALDRYRADGHQPADVIEHCIAGGYQGLFPPKATAVKPASQSGSGDRFDECH